MGYEYVDEQTVRSSDGQEHVISLAVRELPWVRQLCPFMPHEYVHVKNAPKVAWQALDAMIARSPKTYKAFFRGYPTPNRYWDGPDGLRYWRTGMMLNRCDPVSAEIDKVADGAKAAAEWDGPPWAPNGSASTGMYVADGTKWWPGPRFFADGLRPCRACLKPPLHLQAGGP
jgi:hypothetical protein